MFKSPIIIYRLFLFIGVAQLLWQAYLAVQTVLFLSDAVKVSGTVVDLIEHDDGDAFAPVFSFKDANGVNHEIHSRYYQQPPAFKKAQVVTLLYDPHNPQDTQVDSFFRIWTGSFVSCFLGAVFFLVGLGGIYWMKREKNASFLESIKPRREFLEWIGIKQQETRRKIYFGIRAAVFLWSGYTGFNSITIERLERSDIGWFAAIFVTAVFGIFSYFGTLHMCKEVSKLPTWTTNPFSGVFSFYHFGVWTLSASGLTGLYSIYQIGLAAAPLAVTHLGFGAAAVIGIEAAKEKVREQHSVEADKTLT